MTSFSTIRLPKEILFGEGQRDALPAVTRRLGRRALVCTDERLAGSSDFERMVGDLWSAGLTVRVYGRVLPELPCDSAADCAQEARDFAPDRHGEMHRPAAGCRTITASSRCRDRCWRSSPFPPPRELAQK